uniref:Protein kinase domain-containing protein n=1 Tax=Oryza barthii TaxID=65489 RepID=A0A0D3EVA8_9ORYZ
MQIPRQVAFVLRFCYRFFLRVAADPEPIISELLAIKSSVADTSIEHTPFVKWLKAPSNAKTEGFDGDQLQLLGWYQANMDIVVAAHPGRGDTRFVSIDCGLTNGTGYVDSMTNLTYVSDRGFVEGGKTYDIMAQYMNDATNDQEKTLRSFPDGPRNCYTLPSIPGKKYLIRTTFSYGNYDRLNSSQIGSLFLFGLHIGVNFWTTVNLTNQGPTDTIWKELITIAQDTNISVCLINMGSGTPFISTLDLRELDDAMFKFLNLSFSISYFTRLRFGSVADVDFITRYPTDRFDRFWEAALRYKFPFVNMTTNQDVRRLPGNDEFQLPPTILQKASTINSNYSWFNITVKANNNIDYRSLELLPIFHFAEIDGNRPNRTFDIYNDVNLMFPNYTPPPFRVDSTYDSRQLLRNKAIFFTLRKTPNSELPPLINAFEVYSLVRMNNLTTSSDDVNYMKEVKKYYSLARNWNGDPCSPREYSWKGVACNYANGNKNPSIIRVDLSSSGLIGVLHTSFMKMQSLENLLEGNPICSKVKDRYCGNKKNRTAIVLIAVIVPVVFLLLLVLVCLWRLCWKGKSEEQDDYSRYEEETPLHIDIRRFTYAELKLITNNFQSIIGKGGFGTVYHGILENNDEVAVKVLVETSVAESKDFLPEVQTLSKVHHKNLVALVGYCQNKKCLALVYDFMPRGNLQQLLRGGYDSSLNWEERLHIALDAAQGLEYLHESCTPSIVHRDVKTPNILLDKNLVAKISDFGLSRAFNAAHTHISTVAAGTLGYLDPEYHATFQLTVKTDVYSFGIVLLEIVTGQPPVFMNPQTVHLPNWVRQKIARGSIHDVVDKKLLDQYDATHLQTVIDLAMNCLENASIDRPSMTEVVSVLKVCLPISSERQSATSTPRKKNVMDAEIPRQFQLMISGASTTSYEGSSFQSGYTGGVSEISHISGRIDCGYTTSSDYVDKNTTLAYVSDEGYVEGGKNYSILAQYKKSATNKQEETLRSFPDGQRNCYTMPTTTGKKYLIRATFTYGNYDGNKSSENGLPFIFELHIGVNFWTKVNLTNWNPADTVWKEVITVAPDANMSVCLINLGSGTPFISTLDLRILEDAMYPFLSPSFSISYLTRRRFGLVDDFITRYPDDPIDRFWEAAQRYEFPWLNVSTNKSVRRLPGNDYFLVPELILQKASTIRSNFSEFYVNVSIINNLDFMSLDLLPIFHFAEIGNNNPTRTFDIYSDETLLFSNYTPPLLVVDSMYQRGQFLHKKGTGFTLRKTPSSELPPLINAFEVYSLVHTDSFTTSSDDVDYMKEVKKYYSLTRNWNGDPCSPREYSWQGLACNYGNKKPSIIRVNLSASGLIGALHISLMKMPSLENLNLSNNQLDGPILGSILQRVKASQLELRLEGNPICSKVRASYCGNEKSTHILLISVIVPVVSLLVVLCILWKLCWKGKSNEYDDYDMNEEESPLHIDTKRFTYTELRTITNNFQSIIGKGGFGTVYHGLLENGEEVAVKVLRETSIALSKDFLPEVQTLSKVHHKNLVTFVGYCQNKKCLALVYDFMPRGNLQEVLRGGLEYLHESCTPPIVHRDVKTANILLDENLVATIADFGLSRSYTPAHTHISTVAAGTVGYLDPEYHVTFQLTVKADVYSFGIVLLEIITGQPSVLVDPEPVHLPNWVRQKIAKGSIHDAVDSTLMHQYDATSVQSVIELAMSCVESTSIDRPSMTDIVIKLKECLPAGTCETQLVSRSYKQKEAMDADISRQFQLLISGVSIESNEVYS